MHRILAALAILLASAVLGAEPAHALTIIDFRDVSISPNPGVVSISDNRYQSQGVLLDTDGEDGLSVVGALSYLTDGDAGSPTGTRNAVFGNVEGFAFGSVEITFVEPGTSVPGVVDMVSVRIADGETNAEGSRRGLWTVTFFDLVGNIVDQITDDTNDEVFVTYDASAEGPPVHRVVFDPSFEAELVDTIHFSEVTVPVVPEPGTLLLLGTALLAAGIRRGRRPGAAGSA